MRVALLSDTHSHIDASWLKYFESCDEIWHAGDFGNIEVLDYLKEIKPVRAVWGNIDGHLLRAELPEVNIFEVEGMKVMMVHIGGYPGKYESRARRLIEFHRPGLFICGHSHILRVIYDKKYEMLTMNPGAAGYMDFTRSKHFCAFPSLEGKYLTRKSLN
jgi:putative phosphoesterase